MTQPKRLSTKRLRYFKHQFLEESDFQAEQSYHVEMRRHHNRSLHSWGIVSGLEVEAVSPRMVVVKHGWAVDRDGQEIVLREDETVDLGGIHADEDFYLTVLYEEEEADKRPSGAVDEGTRTAEFCVINNTATKPRPDDGSEVPLAKFRLDRTGIVTVDLSIRRTAGSKIAPLTVGTDELGDDSVTISKLDPTLREAMGLRGWVRLPFKPLPLGGKKEQFTLGPVMADSGDSGAGGTASIPVPPGAMRLRAIRLTGTSTSASPTSIEVAVVRGGFKSKTQPESTVLINDRISLSPGEPFDKLWNLNDPLTTLDHKNHTLGISVNASGKTQIWLIAAEFG